MELNPKEKAKQLVGRFIKPTLNDFSDENFEQTKECALICVDEIEKIQFYMYGQDKDFTMYFLEVRQEIQVL